MAEEWRSRHLDILLARPIAPAALVVGKWLAAVGFFVLLLAATLVYPVFLATWGDPDWPPIVASYLGALLLVGLFCAVGTMTSAVTPTAVAAGLGAFAAARGGPAGQQRPGLPRACRSSRTWRASPGAPPGLEDIVYFVSRHRRPARRGGRLADRPPARGEAQCAADGAGGGAAGRGAGRHGRR